MLKYVVKRLLMLIPIALGITFFVFVIMSVTPGDAVTQILGQEATQEEIAAKRAELNLDQPVVIQYYRYIKRVCVGDFGTSWISGQPVLEGFLQRAPNTLRLGALAISFSALFGILLGVTAAVRQHKPIDYFSLAVALIFCSMPIFWLGLLEQLLFSLKLGWFPVTGVKDGLKSYILPATALAATALGGNVRMTRSSMLDVLSQDYVRTSRAKGATEAYTIWHHVIRNGMLPVITQVGMAFGRILGGSTVTENVFAIPGVGAYITNAVQSRDVPVVLGVLIFMSSMICVTNLITDLVYALVDPRVKLG